MNAKPLPPSDIYQRPKYIGECTVLEVLADEQAKPKQLVHHRGMEGDEGPI